MAGGSKTRKGGGGGGGGAGGGKTKRTQPKANQTGIGDVSKDRLSSSFGKPTFDVQAAGDLVRQAARRQSRRSGTRRGS